MQSISRELLEPGMTLAEDVLNPRGQVLIPGGTAIEEKHMRGLKAWGIKAVSITDSTVPEGLLAESGGNPLSAGEADAYLARFFALNQDQLDHPFMSALVEICRAHLTTTGLAPSASCGPGPAVGEQVNTSDDGADDENVKKPAITVDELVEMTSSIASLPNIYFELKNVMNKRSSASVDMADAIRNDPGLTARLLRIVNSAYYSFPSRIETVPRAITIIGTDELTSLVTATSVLSSFGGGLDQLIDINTFWHHSIACGVIARLIAKKRLEQNVERFFVMGLLHDIGKIPMFSHLPKPSRAALLRSRRKRVPLCAAEMEIIGFTHAAAGAALAKSWRMSAGQQEAVSYHHRPDFALRYRVEAAVTHIADIIAHVLCVGTDPLAQVPALVPEAWERLALAPDVLPNAMREAGANISDLIDIFFSSPQT